MSRSRGAEELVWKFRQCWQRVVTWTSPTSEGSKKVKRCRQSLLWKPVMPTPSAACIVRREGRKWMPGGWVEGIAVGECLMMHFMQEKLAYTHVVVNPENGAMQKDNSHPFLTDYRRRMVWGVGGAFETNSLRI